MLQLLYDISSLLILTVAVITVVSVVSVFTVIIVVTVVTIVAVVAVGKVLGKRREIQILLRNENWKEIEGSEGFRGVQKGLA